MPPCLILSIIRYGSKVKWRNPGKGVAPFPTPWCSSYRKRRLLVTLDYIYICVCVCVCVCLCVCVTADYKLLSKSSRSSLVQCLIILF